MGISPTQLIIILVIVALLFGTKKLRGIGGDLGGAVKGFKNAMKDDGAKKAIKDDSQMVDEPVAVVAKPSKTEV